MAGPECGTCPRGRGVAKEPSGVTAVRPLAYCSLSSVSGAVAWFQSHFEDDGKPILPVGGSVHRYMPEQGLEKLRRLLVENQLHPVVHMLSCLCMDLRSLLHTLDTLNQKEFLCFIPRDFPCPEGGAHVLARRETDGYYYLRHIVQEVKGSGEVFLIEFDQSHALKGKVQLYNILHYEDAQRYPLAPGDKVLVPWEAPAKHFGPGTVLRVVENTETPLVCAAYNEKVVLVNFWNGKTKEVSSIQALWIPLPLSKHIVLELQMPLAARQLVVDSSLNYPYLVASGYRASGHYRQGHLHLDCCPGVLFPTHPCAKCSWGCTSLSQCCLGAWHPTQPAECKVQQENAFIPGASLSEEKLNKKIEQELSELRIAPSERFPERKIKMKTRDWRQKTFQKTFGRGP